MARRSMDSAGSSVGAPWTWQRKPSVAYSSARLMPDLASRRLASTSWVLLPMDETIPIPVTTTRLMAVSPHSHRGCRWSRHTWALDRLGQPCMSRARALGAARLQGLVLLEQADLQVEGPVDHVAVGRQPAVGDAEHQFGAHHALEIDAVNDLLHRRQHLAGKLEFPEAERAALAGRAQPAEEKSDHLPKRIEAEAPRHHRITLEVAKEEPELRLHLEFGAHHAFAVLAALLGDLRNPVEHQHRRQRQLRAFGE